MSAMIYLDYQATTPTDGRVVEAMQPFHELEFGNPHSIQHSAGQSAAEAVEKARAQVAALIGADPREIVFTSGATESNNLAIKGAARFSLEHEGRDHIVTVATEHKCVIESCRRLEREGISVTYLPVEANGALDMDRLAGAITERTLMISVMAANNEVGILAPINEIGALAKDKGALFHTDAAQAVGKIAIDVAAAQIDLMSISGHKLYGPMGIGALYVRRRPRVRLIPLIDGGGQERGMRSGTLAPALCVGFGLACEISGREMAAEGERLAGMRDRLHQRLNRALPGVTLNGDLQNRLPGNLNLSFAGTDGTALIEALARDICVSSGSACT
ncbi:MAG: aminotransferase class V-fold PLP-dependent enzyme, partial [Alphaproteobacteria bacterium]|nr:aminotransferase class V-fold PLP-dependent enzyme [Alphaproteobacteria bacterium]